MPISIARAEIPDSALESLEHLKEWVDTVCEFMANKTTYQEAEGLTSFLHDKSLDTSQLKETIMTRRSIVRYKADYASGAYPASWQKVEPLLDGQIPAVFLA